jgi:hypothetical protein
MLKTLAIDSVIALLVALSATALDFQKEAANDRSASHSLLKYG